MLAHASYLLIKAKVHYFADHYRNVPLESKCVDESWTFADCYNYRRADALINTSRMTRCFSDISDI